MKATILNGARDGEDRIDLVQATITAHLKDQGVDVRAYTLRDHKIAYCIGCFGCWIKTPGECIVRDENQDIAQDVIQSDLLILLTPVVFGSYSAELKRMMDHMIPLLTPFFKRFNGKVHHQPRYDHYPAMIGLGIQQKHNPAQAAVFEALVARNAINFENTPSAAAVWP